MSVSRLLVSILAAVLLVSAHPGVAEAQRAGDSAPTADAAPQPSRAERAEARTLFEQARGAIQEGRFGTARDLLRRSLALAPNAGSAFNLAVALRGTGELRSAVATFEALLAGEQGALGPEQAREITELLAATRRDLGHLEVTVSGAERVEVRLDGELVGAAPDGGSVTTEVDPGEHVLTAAAPRRTPYEEHLTIASGARIGVRAELGSTLAGTLVVETDSPEAIVEIVGVARGRGSVRHELPPGEYRVAIHDGERTRESSARVESGELVRVALSMASEPSIVESPWLWTGIGVVLVGVVIAIVVPLTVVSEQPPISDPTYGVVTTLTVPLP